MSMIYVDIVACYTLSSMFLVGANSTSQSLGPSADSSNTILSIGRTRIDDFVFTLTLRTRPSRRLQWTSRIRPKGQELRGELSSMTKTMSLIEKFLDVRFHLCLACKEGRYSFNHRRQNTSARYCTWRHRLREY